jgi:hypothetical protein
MKKKLTPAEAAMYLTNSQIVSLVDRNYTFIRFIPQTDKDHNLQALCMNLKGIDAYLQFSLLSEWLSNYALEHNFRCFESPEEELAAYRSCRRETIAARNSWEKFTEVTQCKNWQEALEAVKRNQALELDEFEKHV